MMKFIFPLFILTFSISLCFGQSWSPTGAKWTYYGGGLIGDGYVEIAYVGDTIVNAITCKKIQKTHFSRFFNSDSIHQYTGGIEITYEEKGLVYLYDNQLFDTLYNFNASIGDQWSMVKPSNICDSIGLITVLDTGSILINAVSLKFLAVKLQFGANASNEQQDTIVEKIGFLNSYYIATDFCDGWVDGNEGGYFKCYEDATFPTYKRSATETCGFTTGLDEFSIEPCLTVYPNPATTSITIEVKEEIAQSASLKIYNAFAQEILISNQLKDIDISALPAGIYFLTLNSKTGIQFKGSFLKIAP